MITAQGWEQHAQRWQERAGSGWRRWLLGLGLLGAVAAGAGLGIRADAVQGLGLLVLVLAPLAAGAPLHRMPGFWPAALGLLWSLGAAWWSFGSWDGLGRSLPLWAWAAIPALCCLLAGGGRTWRVVLMVALLGSTSAAIITVLQACIGFDENAPLGIHPQGLRFWRAEGVLGHWIPNSIYLGLALFGCLMGWRVARPAGAAADLPAMPRWRWALDVAGRWIPRLAPLLIAAGLILAQARTGLVALGAAAVVWSVLRPTRRRLLLLAALLVCAVGGGLLMWLSTPGRIEHALRGEDVRWGLWEVAAGLVAEEPLIGHGGVKGYREVFVEAWEDRHGEELSPKDWKLTHPHNSLLALAIYYGLPALALHLAWLSGLLLAGWRLRREGGDVAVALVVLLLVGGLFESLAGHGAVMGAFALYCGLALCRSSATGLTAQPAPEAAGELGKPIA